MTSNAQIATWLELVNAANLCAQAPRLRSHAVGGAGRGCMALSLDERLLHDGEGRITVFHDADTLRRFLSLSGCDDYASGPPAAHGVSCGDDARCLCLRNGHGLGHCGGAQGGEAGQERGHVP